MQHLYNTQARKIGVIDALTRILGNTGILDTSSAHGMMVDWLSHDGLRLMMHTVHAWCMHASHRLGPPRFVFVPEDEELMDAAASIITSCSGYMACGGKVGIYSLCLSGGVQGARHLT
jgi:hypothetical protein